MGLTSTSASTGSAFERRSTAMVMTTVAIGRTNPSGVVSPCLSMSISLCLFSNLEETMSNLKTSVVLFLFLCSYF